MKTFSIFAVLLLISGALSAQNNIDKAIQQFAEKYPQEKIYLLYDKGVYVAGDNLFFKAFVFDGFNRSKVSTNLNVELYNSSKVLIKQQMIPLFEGEGNGSFTLTDSLAEGVYYIRAYTQWMLNFDERYQYVQSIPVYNITSKKKLVKDTLAQWTAEAFPESGTFVEGITTKVGVRLKSDGVLPESWNGYVFEESKPAEKITTFSSLDRNVGMFFLVPEKNKKYKAVIQDNKGRKSTISLPAPVSSGVSLQVNSTPKSVFFSIRFKDVPAENSEYTIVGTINNILVYRAKIKNDANGAASSIPVDKLINGILQLTLFDKNENAVAQRLCFISPTELTLNEPSFAKIYLSKTTRGLNGFEILPDTSYQNYSVLVMDGATPNRFEEENLLSTFWLTGDLPGKVHAPAKYLGYDADSDALDVFMMTEKWQRFNWASILKGEFPEIKYKPTPYIGYSATVLGSGATTTKETINLIFYYKDSTTQLVQAETDNKGSFELNNLMFEDAVKVYYQINNRKGSSKDVKITFEPHNKFVDYKGNFPAAGYLLVNRTGKDQLPAEAERGLQTRNNFSQTEQKYKELVEVKVTAQKKNATQQLNEQLSSGMFRSMNETVFDFVNDNQTAITATSVLQWLQGRAAGVQIQMQGADYVATIRGSRAQLYLNEMAVDASTINTTPMSDIAMVKIIRGPMLGGAGGGGGGSILVYTRRGDSQKSTKTSPPSLNYSTLFGYTPPQNFLEPDYKDPVFKGIAKDTRDVLVWKPYLPIENNKPISIRFYNNDNAGTIRVVIIGFSKEDDIPMFYNETLK